MNHVYYLGGSPCCGKSTIAEKISGKYGFQYYKADDYLFEFIGKGVKDGDELLKCISEMSLDQLWLRNPDKLNEEQLIIYEKLFPYFMAELGKLNRNKPIITEGAAFLPNLIDKMGVAKTRYICIVPTREFQIKHYSKRPWVNDYLSSCSDKEKAFNNWMERDVLFALSVLKQANEKGYATLVVDGNKGINENLLFVEKCFELDFY